jgi:carboxymethylenebutenolidase
MDQDVLAPEIEVLRRTPLARRGFVMTSIISGFTLATTRVEAQAIHTDAAGLEAGEVKIPVADGQIPGYAARPQGTGAFPTVVVIEEVFGVHEYIQDVCRRLAKLGYLAVAPEIFAREGNLSDAMSYADISAIVDRAPYPQIMTDLDSTVAWAGRNHGDTGRLGVTGFCNGGKMTWLFAAHSRQPKAAVSWYGPMDGKTNAIQNETPLQIVDAINCPVLGLYAGNDPLTTPAMIKQAEAEAKAAGKAVEFVVYPDARHGFHADYRPSYNAADAKDGWQRMLAWFRRYGVTPV